MKLKFDVNGLGLNVPLTRNVIDNRLFHGFLNFCHGPGSRRKIRRQHWEESLKMSKIALRKFTEVDIVGNTNIQ